MQLVTHYELYFILIGCLVIHYQLMVHGFTIYVCTEHQEIATVWHEILQVYAQQEYFSEYLQPLLPHD